MKILLTKNKLLEITKQQLEYYKKIEDFRKDLLEEEEWISFVREYPNLRGLFDSRWGDPSKPKEQLDNFINSFPTEEQVIVIIKLYRSLKKYQETQINLEDDRFFFPIFNYDSYVAILEKFRTEMASLEKTLNLQTNIYDKLEFNQKMKILRESYNMSCAELQRVFLELQDLKPRTPPFHRKAREIFKNIFNEFELLIFHFDVYIIDYLVDKGILSETSLIYMQSELREIKNLNPSIKGNNLILEKLNYEEVLLNDYLYFKSFRFSKPPNTREFVRFYLKHVKTLSRQEIMKICKIIGINIIKKYHPEYYEKSKEVYLHFKDRWFDPELEVFRYDMFENAIYNSKKDINFHSFLINRFGPEHFPSKLLCELKYTDWEHNIEHLRENVIEHFQNVLAFLGKDPSKIIESIKELSNEDIRMILTGYNNPLPKDFILTHNSLYYTIPRGGLEMLGIFMYANKLKKSNYTAFTDVTIQEDKIKRILKLLKYDLSEAKKFLKFRLKDKKDLAIDDIKRIIREIEDTIKQLKEIEEMTKESIDLSKEEVSFNIELPHKYIDKIFLIDDYFASGDNIFNLFQNIQQHFQFEDFMIANVIEMISITKRRNLSRKFPTKKDYDPGAYISKAFLSSQVKYRYFKEFFNILKKSYYYYKTEDIRAIIKIFPKIKRILNGEKQVKLSNKIEQFSLIKTFIGGENHTKTSEQGYFETEYITRDWVDQLLLTVVFPNSIADGESERLLRLLYGHRFLHSIKRNLKILKILLK